MRIIPVLIATLLVISCASSSYNPTVYPYDIDREALAAKPIKKLAFATVNFSGAPTVSYLQKSARRVDAMVEDHLESHGYELIPSYHFENAWRQALRNWGDIYDPTSGKVDQRGRVAVIKTVMEKLATTTDADAVVFTDLMQFTANHSPSGKHYARWHGVTRKVSISGTGSGVPLDFDWGQDVKVASLAVNIYSVDLKKLFSSIGGIDTLQALELKGANPGFGLRDKLLRNESFIEEGIDLAFHPFIPMEDYPGKPKQGPESKPN